LVAGDLPVGLNNLGWARACGFGRMAWVLLSILYAFGRGVLGLVVL
jgi:hypothetical protein